MNRAVYTLTSVLVALLMCAIMVSCGKGYDEVTSVSSDTTIPVEKALQTLSSFNQQTGAETRTQSRQISSVDVTYTEDHTPLAYLVNYSDGKGFAVLAADTGIDPIIAVTDSGSADWSSIMSSADKQLNNASPDYPEVLIAKLIKNGITNPRGGGDDDDDEEEEGGENGPGGGGGGGGSNGTVVQPLLDTNFNFGQQRTYCHKNNGGYIICGCAATALSIVLAYNHFPQQLYVDTELLNYDMCNSSDGVGIKYRVDGKDIFMQISDYYYDYASLPAYEYMSENTKYQLLSKIDENIYNVHGFPTVFQPEPFLRTRYKLCAAMCDTLSCAVRSWDATGALPGKVCNGLTDMGYGNADYWTNSNMTSAQIDTIRFMLTHNKPVIMGGWSLWELDDSHYWVVDGINHNNTYTWLHCNWGWNGNWNGWFSKTCMNRDEGISYDGYPYYAAGIDTTSSWNHLIVYRYDIPDSTVTRHLHPINPGHKTYFY